MTVKTMVGGILVCANCKRAMLYQRYPKKPATASRILHKSSEVCKVKSVMYSNVMNAVIHALKLYIKDFEVKIDNFTDC